MDSRSAAMNGSGRLAPAVPFRIAAVTSHPVHYQAPLFQELARRTEIDMTVYYGHDGSLAGAMDDGFGIPVVWDTPLLAGYRSHFLTMHAETRRTWGRLAGRLAIVGHLWRRHYDAVLIHSYATWLSLLTYAAAMMTGTPILLRTESHLLRHRPALLEQVKRRLLRFLFRRTGAFLVIGEANRQFFARYGAPSTGFFWTPYCVDNDTLTASATRCAPDRLRLKQAIGLQPGGCVLAYCGKLIERKRVEDLVHAAGSLKRRGMPAQLLIIGDGPLRSSLQALCRELEVEAAFVGFQNQAQIVPYLGCADVFVLPSDYETWGLVINEAMACGLPVVTTAVAGAGVDLVEPGVTGFIYPSGDRDALSACLERLVADPALRTAMGAAAHRRVQPYNYRTCADGVVSALQFAARWPQERVHQ
jgi:glycosyltransferase involved in cell wall biosynthesis